MPSLVQMCFVVVTLEGLAIVATTVLAGMLFSEVGMRMTASTEDATERPEQRHIARRS